MLLTGDSLLRDGAFTQCWPLIHALLPALPLLTAGCPCIRHLQLCARRASTVGFKHRPSDESNGATGPEPWRRHCNMHWRIQFIHRHCSRDVFRMESAARCVASLSCSCWCSLASASATQPQPQPLPLPRTPASDNLCLCHCQEPLPLTTSATARCIDAREACKSGRSELCGDRRVQTIYCGNKHT